MTIATSSPIADELISWANKTSRDVIGEDPLQITTESGRTYKVEYVWESDDGKWTSTKGGCIKGLFNCTYCAKLVPGGNWMRVTSNNGESPAAEVRLFEPIHFILKHPESVGEFATNEKCIHVFGRIF